MTTSIKSTTITTIIDCNGTDVTVSTVCEPGESRTDCYDRHDKKVDDQVAKCEEGGGA